MSANGTVQKASTVASKGTNSAGRADDMVLSVGALTNRVDALESSMTHLNPLLSATNISLLASLVQVSHQANDNSSTDAWSPDGRTLWNNLKAAFVASGLMA